VVAARVDVEDIFAEVVEGEGELVPHELRATDNTSRPKKISVARIVFIFTDDLQFVRIFSLYTN
jgi:hypothetical protein